MGSILPALENGHVTDLRFVSILIDTNLIPTIYETGMKWSICAKYVVLGSTENGGDKELLNNFQMPKQELNILYFLNFQTPPGYDHYHSEKDDQQTLSPPPPPVLPGPFPLSHLSYSLPL